ncbi:MAG: putative two-component system response regulator [Alteromonadaceae bacterium]|jgi:putative two-component system response regulator
MNELHVLIVDDVAENIQVAMNILQEDSYEFSFATSGEEALELVDEESEFDLILLDIMMPGMDGFEVCKRLKADEQTRDIPIIFLTAKVDTETIAQGFSLGAVDFVAKPFHSTELLARVANHIDLHREKTDLLAKNKKLENKLKFREERLLSELEANQKELIFILTELLTSTSDESHDHIRRVAEYSRLFAYHHGSLTEDDADTIYHAAPMHDIGKVSISLDLLNKPGPLNEEEMAVIKTHPANAHRFLHQAHRKILKAAGVIAYQHHEKWDGSGYPQGLKGEDIHIFGRIVGLADTFDALTHDRPYRKEWRVDQAVDYILERRGSCFDPELVDIFKAHINDFVDIACG